MRSFTDRHGRRWEIDVTVATLRQIKAALGLDLYQAADSLEPLAAVLRDPSRLVDLLYVVCREQCQAVGVSDEDFGRGFAGDSLEAAAEAMLEAVLDFFPSRQGRETLRKTLAKAKALAALALQEKERELDALDVGVVADSLAAKWKRLSGNAPADSGSTPAA